MTAAICIVDDEPTIRETLGDILMDEGYPVITCANATSLFQELERQTPALIFLDIWLPGMDGMAILSQLRESHSQVPVVMMSGHAGIEAAVNAIKLGAVDFLEKPLQLEVVLNRVSQLLTKPSGNHKELASDTLLEAASYQDDVQSGAVSLEAAGRNQRTVADNVVLNGKGLLTGRNTGIILSPAQPDSGIQFQTLDGTTIPGHITALENFSQSVATHTFTANSTVLAQQNRKVRTVEHLMAALFMAGLDNVLVKADEEIPNIDGSALDFAKVIAEAGTVEQDAKARTLVIHEKILVGIESSQEKHLYAEPAEGFEIQMRVDYPAPIHEQVLTFNPERDSFYKDIAPARSFNTFENIDMAQKQGTVGSGYLNSHIILHDNKVINTELRFPDEFVRHKILDLLGDLFLIGHSVRGRVVANMTSHGYNQALVQKLHQSLASTQS